MLNPPLFKIRPSAGWTFDISELWEYRELLTALAMRDVKLRYKQTALGIAWVLLQPLISAGIFSFVFGRVAHMQSEGIPYFLFSFGGLIGWSLFSNTLTKTSSSLLANPQLITKVFFPRLILPLSSSLSAFLDFLISCALLAVLMGIYKAHLHLSVVTFPLWVIMLFLIAAGVGSWAAALTVWYRDVQYILPVITQLLLYASPIAYAASAVPKEIRTLYMLNPLAPILEGLRWSLFGTAPPGFLPTIYAIVASCTLWFVSASGFKHMEQGFADVI